MALKFPKRIPDFFKSFTSRYRLARHRPTIKYPPDYPSNFKALLTWLTVKPTIQYPEALLPLPWLKEYKFRNRPLIYITKFTIFHQFVTLGVFWRYYRVAYDMRADEGPLAFLKISLTEWKTSLGELHLPMPAWLCRWVRRDDNPQAEEMKEPDGVLQIQEIVDAWLGFYISNGWTIWTMYKELKGWDEARIAGDEMACAVMLTIGCEPRYATRRLNRRLRRWTAEANEAIEAKDWKRARRLEGNLVILNETKVIKWTQTEEGRKEVAMFVDGILSWFITKAYFPLRLISSVALTMRIGRSVRRFS